MKNYLMFALLICATASMAFGQFGVVVDPAKTNVVCPDEECHIAPVFMGEGGFVGELADGNDSNMANFVVSCGNTTASGSKAPDSDGVVRQLFSMANGLACHGEGGSIEIHGLADGGWYWIEDGMNAAVSPLIAKDALMGDEVMPVDPGGLTLFEASDHGTYVKHSSGMVGILPHFVPTAPAPEIPDPEAAAVCGPRYAAAHGVYYTDQTGCMMGDGGTVIAVTGPSNSVGRRSRVTDGMVYRPATGDPVTVSFGLWGNGSGHISTAQGASAGTNTTAALKGWDITASGRHTPEAFKAAFKVDLPDEPSGTLTSAGIGEVKTGPVLERPETESVVLASPDTGKDGLHNDNAGSTAAITNGYGMFKGEPTFCTQKSDPRVGGAGAMLHFAGASGETVMVTVNADGDALNDKGVSLELTNMLTATATWEEQDTWATEWNGQAASAHLIKRNPVKEQDGDTDDTNNETRSLPEVVCDTTTTVGDPKMATASITIEPSPAYCGPGKNHSVRVRVYAPLATAQAENADIFPAIAKGGKIGEDIAASTMLTVMCP